MNSITNHCVATMKNNFGQSKLTVYITKYNMLKYYIYIAVCDFFLVIQIPEGRNVLCPNKSHLLKYC